MFWKKNKSVGNRRCVAIDDNTHDYDYFDIDVKTAICNYEIYQNDLKQRSQDLIKKWCKEIKEASSRGEKFIFTNQFVTDDDKNKILWLINDAGCACNFPPDSSLQYFYKYFEERGFKVVRIECPNNNICCLKIIWISSSDT
jgi:hypothetical protein